MRRYWWLACCITAISLLGCSGENGQARHLLGTASDCDVANESCRISSGAVAVSLALGPDVKPLVSFPIRLQIEGGEVAAQSVITDFQMQEMDMGMNRYRLQLSPQSDWRGKATLPVCTASRMDWLAIVEFTLDGRPYRAIFPFHTEAN